MKPLGRVVDKKEGEKLYTVEVSSKEGIINGIKITGEFFAYPEGLIDSMENALMGVKLETVPVAQAIASAMFWSQGTLVGVRASDLVAAVMEAGKTPWEGPPPSQRDK